MIPAARLNHIAGLVTTLQEAARPQAIRAGVRVRLRNRTDTTGVVKGPAQRLGEWVVRWDSDGELYTIGAQQLEVAR